MSQENEYTYEKTWTTNEEIEVGEMNDISTTLKRLVSEENNFIDNFPKISENDADKTNDIGTHIKEYINNLIYRQSGPQSDTEFQPSIDWTANPPEWNTGLYYTDTLPNTINSIHSLEKRCNHLEEIITLMGTQLMGVSNSTTGAIATANAAKNAAANSATQADAFVLKAKEWATKVEVVDATNQLYSAKHYADAAATSAGNLNDKIALIDNLYWTGDSNEAHTFTLEDCIIPGISMGGGVHLIFNINLGKIIDQNFITNNSDSTTDFYGLKTARDLSVDITSTETIDNVAVPLTQIRLYGKNTWLLNYTNDFNRLDALDGYWSTNKGAAAIPITQKIIVHSPLSSSITLVLTNNNLCKCTNADKKTVYSSAGYGIPFTAKTKNSGGRIGGSVPVLMFVKKLLIKYTPYISSGVATQTDTEPAAGTGNNDNP